MNIFTKEELYFLRDYTEYFIYHHESENAPEVLDKIQLMINNYKMNSFKLEELNAIYQNLDIESDAVTEELLDKIVQLIFDKENP